ncbi:bifunctional metallophosphatase/5'-nucleotidase [Ectothiorhodospira shaposhnikovii]|uniref:bifunctional metallophosphatase/5'-nucleotidase n=1 Tax=Ectothiorhodospira shaposhnikovii TaxID=1054 RepID=UPI001EE87C62|nr:bifunctional metallophosphatase/5'-nucleotidase [Ectothiorhodospira shaposhnikovii]MCG5513921.1 bifunctional metallophosphatase/5'-nucleotidase [Ectothiorhodospira shaposhnikovii]
MRKVIFTLLLTGLPIWLIGCNSSNSSSNDQDTVPRATLTLLHTNDIHARLEPVSATFDGDPEHGGVARVKTVVNQVRSEVGDDNVLLVDAGDYSQGTIFWNAWKTSDAIMFLNDIGYDAITLGNHEFNLGPANLAARLEGLPVTIAGVDYATEAAAMPVVVTNLDLSGVPELDARVQPSAIVDKAGVRIGIVGLITDTTQNISSPGSDVVFLDYVDSVQAEVNRLHNDGVRHIVLLSHVNYTDDLRLAGQLSGVDIIVSGHDHVLLGDENDLPEWTHRHIRGPYPAVVEDLDGNTTLVVSAWEWTRAVGRLDVEFDDRGRVVNWSGGPIMTELSIAEEPDLAQKVADYRVPVNAFADVIIGSSGMVFDGNRNRMRYEEMPLGNLVTDTMLNFDQIAPLNVDAALANGGGIRASIDSGDVSYGDALSVLPFGNSLVVMDVTGEELVAALDNGLTHAYDAGENRIRSTGAWPQVAGMTVTYCLATVADIQADPAVLPPASCADSLRDGGVVTRVEIGGEEVTLDQTYRIVTNNFLASGGDFYESLAQACKRSGNFCEDTFFLMLDAFIAEFENHSPVTRAVEGRLVAE